MEEKVIKTIGLGVLSWTITFLTSRRIFFQLLVRLLQAHCLYNPCTFICNVSFTLCSRLELSTLSCASNIFPCAGVWLGEMSSPFLHLREFLKQLGYRDTACNLAADILFAATYAVVRFVFGAYVAYVILSADNPPISKVSALNVVNDLVKTCVAGCSRT